MGSFLEINNTLRINKKQGFPKELEIKKYIVDPCKLKEIEDKVFSF